MLTIGSKGIEVQRLQIALNVLGYGLATDGIYGAKTEAAIVDFTTNQLGADKATKNAGDFVIALINKAAYPAKFVVILDAGHGGIDPNTGEYTTPATNGKRYHHPNAILHEGGWFYEGVANRIAADALATALQEKGIEVVKAYHPYIDLVAGTNSKELLRRGNVSLPYIKQGYRVLFYSIHSNAAPTSVEVNRVKRKRTKAELDKIRGFEFYSTEKETLSDKGTAIFAKHYRLAFGEGWQRSNGEKDADFGVLRPNEDNAKVYGAQDRTMAVLAEIGVFTAEPDAKMLTEEETHEKRLAADLGAILEIKEELSKL